MAQFTGKVAIVTGGGCSLSPDVLQVLEGKHALNRLGTGEEVSHLVCFLLSEEASLMTGGYYLVDGAYTAV